jgi:hypothetical protein
MAYVLQKLGAKRIQGDTDRSKQARRLLCPTAALSPPRPKLLPVAPHDRRRRLEPNADAATLVDIGAFGGDAPDDILGGQYRCHLSPP